MRVVHLLKIAEREVERLRALGWTQRDFAHALQTLLDFNQQKGTSFMSALPLPAPGTRYGPCLEQCAHTDCAGQRHMANTLCSVCEKPIGYDTPFYQSDNWQTFTHAICLEEQAEESRQQETASSQLRPRNEQPQTRS